VTDRRPPPGPASPGEQFRDRIVGGLATRSEGEPQLVGAVVVIAVILLLIPRGQGGPDLWLVVALVFGGALIETVRIMRSGEPPRSAIVSAGRLLAGPFVFVAGAALVASVGPSIVDEQIPRPVLVAGLLALMVVAWITIWRLFRVR
jgi:hypothetical protein